ncbi:LOW QUALITY PROTEIN: CKLF-like MARVEL transmembrane domain-containing protein 2 [Camelus ferus]|uniref:LOW QUALITY PROTEIN: CKLF-like MARVEL transmembrane domain-containing protein 2 n=1 Tax=Camelus ferus TaxID=419612 RepID=A0A8B6YC66_CAMFR|nr:LOW QUALITY PROTEIN: CKLF-like MARVEL transmembrane domain-containing protein 2 [Camelus ferus]
MADKGKKGKPGPAPAPGTAPAAAEPAPAVAKTEEKKEEKPKSVQPKDEVGTRKGCRRYRWEFKDSNREFWVMGHAEVKILSLGCLIGSLIMFTGTTVHPLLTLIITMELSIFCFFIIVYTFAIQRYMPFILWPISDLLNDLFACGFLGWAVYFAVTSRQTMPLHYVIAVVLIGVAGLFALIDVCLQRKHFKGKKVRRNVLIPPGKEKEGEKAKEGGKPGEGDKGKDKGAAPAAPAAKGGKK